MPFVAGSTIRIREVLHGSVWLETPATVVSDDGDLLASIVDPGAPFTFPDHPFGAHPWSTRSWWAGATVLRLHRTGLYYSAWRFFRDGEGVDGWYINFERPVVRGPEWIDVDDWGLDIVVGPGRSWEWKDIDDPERLVEAGRLRPSEIGDLRRAAVCVARMLRSGSARWWDSWETWRPFSLHPHG